MGLGTVEALLRTRIGLAPDAAGPGLIRRAVRARMARLGLPETEAEIERYAAILETSTAELQALVEEVVVSESWFFRDEVPFAILAEHASRRLADDPARPPYRVLSIPCASGEEPYSAAIALVEAGLPPIRFRIVAADVSRNALARARRAVYSRNAFRTPDLGFRDRHFQLTPEGYALERSVVDLVRFHEANVLAPDFLADEGPFDAIFCRNLLIYLEAPARAVVLGHVDRLLAVDGRFFVGHAENSGLLGDRYRALDARGGFAFERSTAKVAASPPRAEPERGARRPSPPAPPVRSPGAPLSLPSLPVDRRALPAPATTSSLLEQASRLADEGRHDTAARLCDDDLRLRGPSAPTYFLLGMIAQSLGDRDKAASCFEKAVYLDGRHEDALLALALLAQRRGDAAAAANFRRRAERAYQENHRQ